VSSSSEGAEGGVLLPGSNAWWSGAPSSSLSLPSSGALMTGLVAIACTWTPWGATGPFVARRLATPTRALWGGLEVGSLDPGRGAASYNTRTGSNRAVKWRRVGGSSAIRYPGRSRACVATTPHTATMKSMWLCRS
jgi:hypothetical protein